MEFNDVILVAAVTGITSAAASWGATAVHLRWLRRDVDAATKDAKRANGRIDGILSHAGGKRFYDTNPADPTSY
jgi:hypothetical protein